MPTILIVDDETLLVRMYQTALEAAGYTVETADNGGNVVETIRRVQPALVLLDIMMPKQTGLEVLDTLKKDPVLKDVPVIMLTNLTWLPGPEIPLAHGALDVWLKSAIKPKELVARVNKFLEGKNSAIH